MKKPVVRILLLLVLLGLAIFYFRYMREGFTYFADEEGATVYSAGTAVALDTASTTDTASASRASATALAAATTNVDVTKADDAATKAATNATTNARAVFAEGSSCPQNGKQAKTDQGKNLYCCAGTWKSTVCS